METGTRRAVRIWQAAVAAVVVVALVLQLVLTVTGGVDANSGESGAEVPMLERLVRSYSFFTVDSNILVLIVAAAMAVNPVRTSVVWRVLYLTALVSIIITGVVFSFVIAEGLQLTPAAELVTICFHYVVPWLFVLGWLLFGPRPQWSPRLLPLVFVWPAGWLGYTFVRGAITGWYPYPFLDARELGLAVAVRNAAIVTVVAVAVASILLLVDRFVPSIGYRRREQAL